MTLTKHTCCPKCGWAFSKKEMETQVCQWCGTDAQNNDMLDDLPADWEPNYDMETARETQLKDYNQKF